MLLYERGLEVQAGVFWVTPETMTVDADGLSNLGRDVTTSTDRF